MIVIRIACKRQRKKMGAERFSRNFLRESKRRPDRQVKAYVVLHKRGGIYEKGCEQESCGGARGAKPNFVRE